MGCFMALRYHGESSIAGFRILNAAKAEVICAGIDIALAACTQHIARAVLVCAEKGSPPLYPHGLIRIARIRRLVRTLGIMRHPAL